MGSSIISTIAGLGIAVIIARASITKPIRRFIYALYETIFIREESVKGIRVPIRTRIQAHYEKEIPKLDWCLYCTGTWVGLFMHFIDPVSEWWFLEMGYYCAISWLAMSVTTYLMSFKMDN
jgi:hypothetical protein